MKRFIAGLALAVGLAHAHSVEAQTRTFIFAGCDSWGCATVTLRGEFTPDSHLTFGLPIADYFVGSYTSRLSGTADDVFTRAVFWQFNSSTGVLSGSHNYEGEWRSVWGESAVFSPDFNPTSVSGGVHTCAAPDRATCPEGAVFTNYGTVTLSLQSVTTTVPEPATIALLITGLAGIAGVRRCDWKRRSRPGCAIAVKPLMLRAGNESERSTGEPAGSRWLVHH